MRLLDCTCLLLTVIGLGWTNSACLHQALSEQLVVAAQNAVLSEKKKYDHFRWLQSTLQHVQSHVPVLHVYHCHDVLYNFAKQ